MKRLQQTLLPILATSIALVSTACGPSFLNKKPSNPTVNKAVTAMWAADVKKNAQTGDWILSRSYSAIGDVIVIGTSGEAISHSSIYDAERGTVIEAISSGVREVPLEDLLARNHMVVVVRPSGLSAAQRRESIARARRVVGSDFDYTGLLGASADKKFYCSELVVWASGLPRDAIVVTPAELIDRGRVVYFSGNRDDAQVQGAAGERRRIVARRRGAKLRTAALARTE